MLHYRMCTLLLRVRGRLRRGIPLHRCQIVESAESAGCAEYPAHSVWPVESDGTDDLSASMRPAIWNPPSALPLVVRPFGQ